MSLISASLFTVCAILVILVWKRWRDNNNNISNAKENFESIEEESFELNVPKGPFSFPIIGNLLQLGDRPYEKMIEWSKTYGPVYQLYLGSQLVVVINGTDAVREALIDQGELFAGRPKLYMIHATLKGISPL